MIIGKVIGNVVSTRKDEKLKGAKLLIVHAINIFNQKLEGKYVVAVDTVGAGEGEVVLVVNGSSARQTTYTKNKPVDSAIIAILDFIEVQGKRTFSK